MRITKVAAVAAPLVTIAVVLLVGSHPAYSNLPTLASPSSPVHWSVNAFPIQFNINPSTTGTKVTGGRPVADVITAAFDTWKAAPNTSLPVTRGADSSVNSESGSPQNINLICFVCSDADFTKDTQTLAVTLFTFATAAGQSDGHGGSSQFAGQMLKADIIFNPSDAFTTDPASASDSVTDLQTVATHEIGHFFGLDHSAVINAIMFPFSPAIRESLAYDDVAGISGLYGGNQTVGVGAVQGTVSFQSGGGVFGAHVFADSTTATNGYGAGIRKGPIGTLTQTNGAYTINGLPADSYTVAAEPLDGPVTNGDVSAYPKVFGQGSVQTNFTTRQH